MANILCSSALQLKCSRVAFTFLRNSCFIKQRSPFQTLSPQTVFLMKYQEPVKTNDLTQKCRLSLATTMKTSQIGHSDHDHGKHWTAEKALTAIMFSTIPAAVIYPSPVIEYFLALSVVIHSHWGLEAIVVDYVTPSVFGNVIPKVALGTVYTLSFLTLGGLFYFIYTDVGIINAVKLLWKL